MQLNFLKTVWSPWVLVLVGPELHLIQGTYSPLLRQVLVSRAPGGFPVWLAGTRTILRHVCILGTVPLTHFLLALDRFSHTHLLIRDQLNTSGWASADLQCSPLWYYALQNVVTWVSPNSQPYLLRSGSLLGPGWCPLPVLWPKSPRLFPIFCLVFVYFYFRWKEMARSSTVFRLSLSPWFHL